MIFLGIGSNLNNPLSQIQKALHLLPHFHIKILKTSSIYKTKPWGVENQPPFYNLITEIYTELDPSALLEILQLIESVLGRKRFFRWGPRIIDIDILLYHDLILQTPRLQIPHSFLCERPFWIIPLLELYPHLYDPTTKKPLKEFPAAYEKDSILAIYPVSTLSS